MRYRSAPKNERKYYKLYFVTTTIDNKKKSIFGGEHKSKSTAKKICKSVTNGNTKCYITVVKEKLL